MCQRESAILFNNILRYDAAWQLSHYRIPHIFKSSRLYG